MKIKFVDTPPPSQTGVKSAKGAWSDFATELRRNPGRWAEVPRKFPNAASAYSFAHHIRKGGLVGFKTGKWEAVGRTRNNQHVVYVRYMKGGRK